MPIEFRITRIPPISLDEWRAAITRVPHVREASGDVTATNPFTGEVISIQGHPGDAEVQVDGDWLPLFRRSPLSGNVSFRYVPSMRHPESPLRRAAAALAATLGARMTDDEGFTVKW